MTIRLQLGSAETKLEGVTARIFAGRDPSTCQLSLADPTLSRRHAELFVENGQLFIHDLGSANGTWVDGQHLGADPYPVAPNSQIWLGQVQLGVQWEIDGSATVMAQNVPAELKALIAARQQQHADLAAGGGVALGAGTSSTPLPATMAYRKQGSNSNGVMLLALAQDTFWSGGNIEGFVEFTSEDNQTVASITVELVQFHRKRGSNGHVWDRFLVRQGPWRAAHGDVLPLPFQLRVPAGTAMTSKDVSWEIRGDVDINWASDIHAEIPITMRNPDIERIRDALGAMDYRVVDIDAADVGQHFEGTFAPPANMAKQLGINEVRLTIEYLGANLKVRMLVDRKGMHHDKAIDQVFELGRLRAASQGEVNATFQAMLQQLTS
jgi:sporulation-control protein spo0M